MTDLEILMGESPEAAPLELQSYSEWSKTAPPVDDEIQNRRAFSDYIREEYIKADQYSIGVEKEIRDGLTNSLVAGDDPLVAADDQDTLDSLYKRPDRPFDEQVNLIQSSIGSSDPDWDVVTRYKALNKVVSADPDAMPDTIAKLEEAKLQAEQVVQNRFDDVKRIMVHNGELAFAFVTGIDGEPEFIAGDRAMKSDFLTAIKDSKIGGVQMSDAFLAQDQLKIQEGTSVPRYKYKRLREAHDMIQELAKEDQLLEYQISGHGSKLASLEYDNDDRWQLLLNDMGQDMADAAGWLIGKVTGGDQDERTAAEREKRTAIANAGNTQFDEATKELTQRLNAVADRGGDAFTLEEVQSAYKQIILEDANNNNKFEFHDGDDEVGKNIRTYGYLGPVVHPAAMANKDVFDKMLAARPDIDESVRENLKTSREAFLESNFASMSDLLLRSSKSDDWSDALTKGRAEGKSNPDILSDYLADEDNYSAFGQRVKGIGWSMWDAVSQIASAIPAALGADWAQNALTKSAQRNSDRREVANLFGDEFGFVQDIGETIAPLLTDVAATAVLATATAPAAGAGGAAFLAAKQGARLTAKGVGKALVTSAFREGGEEAVEGLIKKTFFKQGVPIKTAASEAIRGYNSLFAKRIGNASAAGLVAANRSGGATYGTLFNELQKSTDLSREEIHDRALGGALLAGAFTGFITGGFAAIGRGGIDDILLKGGSFKDISTTLKAIANTKNIDDQTVARAMELTLKEQLKKSLFSSTKPFFKNALDEGIEESLDEFVNGFVQDAVLEENTPMLERMQQSLYAGAIGAVMGAGAPAVQRVAATIRPDRFSQDSVRARVEADFDNAVAERLANTGSPLTAEAFRNLRSRAARELDTIQLGSDPTPTEPAPTEPAPTEPAPTEPAPTEPTPETAPETAPEELEQGDLFDGLDVTEVDVETSAENLLTEVNENLNEGNGQEEIQLTLNLIEQRTDTLNDDGEGTATLPATPETTSDFKDLTFGLTGTRAQAISTASGVDAGTVVRNETGRLAVENPSPDIDPRRAAVVGYASNTPRAIIEELDNSSEGHFDLSAFKGLKAVESIQRDDLKPFREGSELTPDEMAEVDQYVTLAIRFGVPVRVQHSARFGLPKSLKMSDKSDFLAKVVYHLYPLVPTMKDEGGGTFKGRKVTRFDPVKNQKVEGTAIRHPLDADGHGVFNNDPIAIAELLSHGVPVKAPDPDFVGLNPAFKGGIRDGFIVDVFRPSLDGKVRESMVTAVDKLGTVELDHSVYLNYDAIPFIRDMDQELREGTVGVDENGIDTITPPTFLQFETQLNKLNRRFEEDKLSAYFQSYMSARKGGSLLTETKSDSMLAAIAEFRALAYIFQIRQNMLITAARVEDRGGNPLLETKRGREVVTSSGRKRLIKQLSDSMLTDDKVILSDRLLPFLTGVKSKATNTDIIVKFIEDVVINNKDFDGDVMPTFSKVVTRTNKRYSEQQESKGLLETSNSTVGFDTEEALDAAALESVRNHTQSIADDLDPVDLPDPVIFVAAVRKRTNEAIEAIEGDPEMREALNDLAFQSIYPDADSTTRTLVAEKGARELMDDIGGWMLSKQSTAVGREFNKLLESGRFKSGNDLRNAIKANMIGHRSDGDPTQNAEYVEEMRVFLRSVASSEPTTNDARNFIKQLDAVMQSRLSRSHLTKAQREQAALDNAADVERLGLVSGDPDSVVKALETIAKTSKSENHKLVAEMLLEDADFIRSVPFGFGNFPDLDKAGEFSIGQDGVGRVVINMATGNGRGLENVLLEEYTHAVLFDTINKDPALLNDKKRQALQRLKGLRELAQQSYVKNYVNKGRSNAILEDGLANLDEFAAAVLLSPEFQYHLKTLDSPQRNFFQRLLDIITSMFRKVSKTEGQKFSQAMQDVLDLGPKPRFTVGSQMMRGVAYEAGQRLQATKERRSAKSAATVAMEEKLGTQAAEDSSQPVKQTIREAYERRVKQSPADLQRSQEVEALIDDDVETDPQLKADLAEAVAFLKDYGNVPFGIPIRQRSFEDGSIASFKGGKLFIDPLNLKAKLATLKSQNAKRGVIQSIITEEAIHASSYGVLTKTDIVNIRNSMTRNDFIEVAKAYYSGVEDTQKRQERIDESIARLDSPDEATALRERNILVEERLRKRVQQVTRGFTTEEDNAFWSRDPSLLAILKRYITGALNKLRARRGLANGDTNYFDAAINAMVLEVKAIELGFSRQNSVMSLDTSTPAAVVETYERLMSYSHLDDIESQSVEDDFNMTLLSSVGVIDTANALTKIAGIQLEAVPRKGPKTGFAPTELEADPEDLASEATTVRGEVNREEFEKSIKGLNDNDMDVTFTTSDENSAEDPTNYTIKFRRKTPSLDENGLVITTKAFNEDGSEKIDDDGNPVLETVYDVNPLGFSVVVTLQRGPEGAEIYVDSMFADKGAPDMRRGSSVPLVAALVANNLKIGAARLVTTAGGDGSGEKNKQILDAMLSAGLDDLIRLKASRSPFVDTGVSTEEEVYNSYLNAIKDRLDIISYDQDTGAVMQTMTGYKTWPSFAFILNKDSQDKLDNVLSGVESDADIQDLVTNSDVYTGARDNLAFIEDISSAVGSMSARAVLDTGEDAVLDDSISVEELKPFLPAVEVVRKQHADGLKQMIGLLKEKGSEGREFDLFEAWHGEGANTNTLKRLWNLHGFENTMEFDLNVSGGGMNVLANSYLMQKVIRVPEVKAVVNKFNTDLEALGSPDENPQYGEQKQELRDTYNAEFHELGFDFNLFSSVGSSGQSSQPISRNDFSEIVNMLEMPMAEYDTYKAPKGWFVGTFRSAVGEPLKSIVDQRDQFRKAAAQLVPAYKKTLDRLILQTFKGGDPDRQLTPDQVQLLARAQSYVDGDLVSVDARNKIDEGYRDNLNSINTNPEITPEQAEQLRSQAKETRQTLLDNAYNQAKERAIQDRDAALAELNEISPALASHIMDIRNQIIQPLGTKISKILGADKKDNENQLGIKIDQNGGLYLTRAYEMFTDPTYIDRVKTDPTYAKVRQAAARMFPKEFIRMRIDQEMQLGKSLAEATEIAKADLAKEGPDYGARMVDKFLSNYGSNSQDKIEVRNLDALSQNLMARKDLPKEMRDLLGELGPEKGTDLIIRTTATVTALATQQNFLYQIKDAGLKGGFISESPQEGYVSIRPNGGTTSSDPLAGLYMDADIYEALKAELDGSSLTNHVTTAQEAIGTIGLVARKLTGTAMVMKTLGSVGFYLRNLLGNVLFFGPAQGYGRLDKMLGSSLAETGRRVFRGSAEEVDARLSEYIALGVVGDEVRAGIMKELLDGKAAPESVLDKVDQLTDDIILVNKGKKGLKWLQNKAIDMSVGVDSGYKIALFEFELDVLRKAGLDVGERELKRMAARKVKMTAQSLSQAPPIITAATRSPFGLLFAPFLRFKVEVPRIVINTYKLGFEEINSGNTVLQRRGYQRIGAMTGMLGIMSTVAATVTSRLFSDIGDEEDEALRKSMPEYLRGHNFFYFRFGGNLQSIDLTYLNPFSLIGDPIMRSLSNVKKGEFGAAGASLVKGLIFDTYLDEQILAGTVQDVLNNKNSTTDRDIWTPEVDGAGDALVKSLAYIFKGAYEPRILKDAINAKNAIGGDYTEFSDSPIGELLDGAYPVRFHKVDLEQQYRRFLRDHTRRMKVVTDKKYAMYSKRPIGDEEIRDIYDEEFKGRKALNAELLRVGRGFEGLGVSPQQGFKLMTSNGVGKDKAKLLYMGVMDRPDVNKRFAQGLYQRNLQHRLQPLVDQMSKYNRYILIEDPE